MPPNPIKNKEKHMLTTDIRTSQHLTEDTAARVAELWNTSYPAMRDMVGTVIRAHRGAEQTEVDVPRLERLRRELGQVDRGTHRPCTRSAPRFSPLATLSLVEGVIRVMPVGSPHAGGIYRLAAELSDLTAE